MFNFNLFITIIIILIFFQSKAKICFAPISLEPGVIKNLLLLNILLFKKFLPICNLIFCQIIEQEF